MDKKAGARHPLFTNLTKQQRPPPLPGWKGAFENKMKTLQIGKARLETPAIAVGCMRLRTLDRSGAERYLKTALELGLNFFDHADLYGGGECETLFADALDLSLRSDLRDKIVLQSKCGIEKRDGKTIGYNFSKSYILRSVDAILKRLRTDYLDLLVLHRPDALMEPEEVAEAFENLSNAGKVHQFGVSNHSPRQIKLLQNCWKEPLAVNQLQLSVANCSLISAGINVNLQNDAAIDRDGGILDYCRLHDITIQAWSPLQYGFFEGSFIGSEKFPELNRVLNEVGAAHGISAAAAAIAWLLRHPAGIQPVVGTMNPDHLRDLAAAGDVTLSREEWYAIYMAAGNQLP